MFEKFDIDDNNIFKVCVVATMSSGKSTFINAIIGDEILPEKNEACTARTMVVLDNDSAVVKKAHIIRMNGSKEIVEISDREVLERINNDEDVKEFLVETDIKSIKNTSRALMLVDTPGVNNSEDQRHGERTQEFLKQMDLGVIIYLLNATQLATNDDSLLLQIISDHVAKMEGQVKILFVINKIDALDEETESIAQVVKIAKEHIENHGINRPVIYPLSALAAKSLKMVLHRRKMSKREVRKLEDVYDHYQARGNNMLAYAVVDDWSEESYEIGGEEVSAHQLQRAIDNTGITAIERKLENYMLDIERYFAPEVVIKVGLSENSVQKFQNQIKEISYISSDSNFQEFDEMSKRIIASKIIQSRNKEFSRAELSSVIIDLQERLRSASSDLDLLVLNIGETKRHIFDMFKSKRYVWIKNAQGRFFSPENNLKECINAKKLYIMSEDGLSWREVNFAEITRVLEKDKELYLFNQYAGFLFKVTKESGTDVIGLLDIKLPIRIVEVAGVEGEHISLEDMNIFMSMKISEAEERKKEIEDAEEILRRTYKGITFISEEKKNTTIRKELEFIEYCKKLNDKSYEELWNAAEEISMLPSVINTQFSAKVAIALDIQEKHEKEIYYSRIQLCELDGLDDVTKELQKQHYTDVTKNDINLAIEQRRIICQKKVLEKMMYNIEQENSENLRHIKQLIENQPFQEELKKEFLNQVEVQCDIAEQQELKVLGEHIHQSDMEELQYIENTIRARKYKEVWTQPVLDVISCRYVFLHKKNMEHYCTFVSVSDRDSLSIIKKKIDQESCAEELKKRFYELIDQRNEDLDYEEICLITNKLSTLTLDELEKLYVQIENGQYNKKFVKKFCIQVRGFLEYARKKRIDLLVEDVQQVNKEQLMKIDQEINRCRYSPYIIKIAQEKIETRRYILDMQELIAIENDFDSLTLDDIINLRNQINYKNVCEKSKETYFNKLREREVNIAYQLVSPYACFARQIISQYGLSGTNVQIATFSSEYDKFYEKYCNDGGEKEYSNIPILFLPDCSSMAITKTHLYFRKNTTYLKILISGIRSFSTNKKLFGEELVITLKNNNSLIISNGINKNNSRQIENILTSLVQNISREDILARYQPYRKNVKAFSEQLGDKTEISEDISVDHIIHIFLYNCKTANIDYGSKLNLKTALMNNWNEIEKKVRNGFHVVNERRIIMYHDYTLLNSAKEGFAIGVDYFHIKENNRSLVSIPYKDIYEIYYKNNQLVIVTVSNDIFMVNGFGSSADTIDVFTKFVAWYVQGIQFVCFKSNMKEENIAECEESIADYSELKICPKCNHKIKTGAKFCSTCGAKIMEIDKRHCVECGDLLIEGAKFCKSCGKKVEGM